MNRLTVKVLRAEPSAIQHPKREIVHIDEGRDPRVQVGATELIESLPAEVGDIVFVSRSFDGSIINSWFDVRHSSDGLWLKHRQTSSYEESESEEIAS